MYHKSKFEIPWNKVKDKEIEEKSFKDVNHTLDSGHCGANITAG
jgi:hypothetical protein